MSAPIDDVSSLPGKKVSDQEENPIGEIKDIYAIDGDGQLAAHASLQLLLETGVGGFPGVIDLLPLAARLRSARSRIAPVLQRFRRDVEWLLGRISQGLLGQRDLILSERRAVGLSGVVLVGASVADVRANYDE